MRSGTLGDMLRVAARRAADIAAATLSTRGGCCVATGTIGGRSAGVSRCFLLNGDGAGTDPLCPYAFTMNSSSKHISSCSVTMGSSGNPAPRPFALQCNAMQCANVLFLLLQR